MKVLFLGTPNFAVKILDSILKSCHEVVGVVTQTDKINGRGNKISFSAVKEFALKKNLKVYQFEKISKEIEIVNAIDCDIMVTCAYGQILSQEILNCKKYGVINVHTSTLPQYRGASPVQSAIIDGEEYLGITIMKTAYKVDSGDIILQDKMKMIGDENYIEALEKIAFLGSELIVKALNDIENGKVNYLKQDESQATLCKMYKKEDGKINFNLQAKAIHNFIRGVTPWPSAYFISPIGKLKVVKAKAVEGFKDRKIGEVVISNSKLGLIIQCKEGALSILQIQAENSKAMDIKSFLLGKKLEEGTIINE